MQNLLEQGAVEQHLRAWQLAFAQDSRGVNTRSYLWHVFSANHYPSICGLAALEAYQAEPCAEFVVIANDRITGFTTTERLEQFECSDTYVFPANLAWTMAFTHEDGRLGPYFAKHANYTQLVALNTKALRKQAQIAAARKRGWA
jgi:hypothetical protein